MHIYGRWASLTLNSITMADLRAQILTEQKGHPNCISEKDQEVSAIATTFDLSVYFSWNASVAMPWGSLPNLRLACHYADEGAQDDEYYM